MGQTSNNKAFISEIYLGKSTENISLVHETEIHQKDINFGGKTMYYLDPKVEKLFRIFDQNERSGYLRLDLNENPGGLPKEFVQKVLEGDAGASGTVSGNASFYRGLGKTFGNGCCTYLSCQWFSGRNSLHYSGIHVARRPYYWRCTYICYVSDLFGNVWSGFCGDSI